MKKKHKLRKLAIKINKLTKNYPLREERWLFKSLFVKNNFFPVLKDINLTIYEGEKIGVIGDNGAGKTTLLKIISEITSPTKGVIKTFGKKVVSLIDLTAGFNLDFSGRENIYLNGVLLGMDRKTILTLEEKIIKFAELDEYIDQPLYTYSSGMILRLGFSVAIYANPDIFILDENFIVGDQHFQKKAYDHIEKLFNQGKTIIFSSHFLPLLKRLCNRFIWMDNGKIIKDGDIEVLREYQKKNQSIKMEKSPSNKYAEVFFAFLKKMPIGEKFITTAGSGSMEPFIIKGDEVEVTKIDFNDLKKGNIIAFWSNEFKNVVIHRFYKLSKGKILTKGDNNIVADVGYVEKKNFLGIVTNF